MLIRLTRKYAECIDGVDLTNHRVGQIIDLPERDAALLIAEKWATPTSAEFTRGHDADSANDTAPAEPRTSDRPPATRGTSDTPPAEPHVLDRPPATPRMSGTPPAAPGISGTDRARRNPVE
jgi:hypothetical protein